MASDGTDCKEFLIVVDNKTDQIWKIYFFLSMYLYYIQNDFGPGFKNSYKDLPWNFLLLTWQLQFIQIYSIWSTKLENLHIGLVFLHK